MIGRHHYLGRTPSRFSGQEDLVGIYRFAVCREMSDAPSKLAGKSPERLPTQGHGR